MGGDRSGGNKGKRRQRELSRRETLFVLLLDLNEGNATQTVLDVGFCPNGNRDRASEYAQTILARPRVQHALKLLRERDNLAARISVNGIKSKLWAAFVASSLDGKNVVKLGKLLAEMTPGALVPRKMEHSGVVGVSLDQLVPKRKPPAEGGQ